MQVSGRGVVVAAARGRRAGRVGARAVAWLAAALAAALSLGPAAGGAGPGGEKPAEARAVLRAILDNVRGGSVQATLAMTVVRPGGETRYRLEILGDGQQRALIRVTSPAREAGQAFLRDGDDLWLYVPRLRRVLRLPPGGKTDRFLASDLSYSDLSGRDAETDYEPRILSRTAGEVVLELVPVPGAPTPYGRLTLRASTPGYEPLEMIFFDQRGQAVRRVSFEAYVSAAGHRIPTRITVEDLLRPGQRTVASYERYRFGVAIPPSCFTLQALEAGCPEPSGPEGGGGR